MRVSGAGGILAGFPPQRNALRQRRTHARDSARSGRVGRHRRLRGGVLCAATAAATNPRAHDGGQVLDAGRAEPARQGSDSDEDDELALLSGGQVQHRDAEPDRKAAGGGEGDMTGTGVKGGVSKVLKPGDVVYVPPGVPHYFSAIPDHVTEILVRW